MKAFILAVVLATGLSTLAGYVMRDHLSEPAGYAFSTPSARPSNPAGVAGERFAFF
jgi:hypothetical protein